MYKYQILQIIKTNRTNPHERISSIRGVNKNGSRWEISQQQAIRGIESGRWRFYVSQGGRTLNVIVGRTHDGGKYIKTIADGIQPNHLLQLTAPNQNK